MAQEEFPRLNVAHYLLLRSLPPQSSGFVGREEAMERLCSWLPRPVRQAALSRESLPGDLDRSGWHRKRLALEVGHRLSPAFKEAVWFVPLDSLTDASLIVDRVLETLPACPGRRSSSRWTR